MFLDMGSIIIYQNMDKDCSVPIEKTSDLIKTGPFH